MRVLWLIPGYYPFLVEELACLASQVEDLAVISQAKPIEIPGVRTIQVAGTRPTPGRVARRGVNLLRFLSRLPWPRTRGDRSDYRAIVRQCEFIADYIRRERVDVVHSHFAWPRGTAGFPALRGRPLVLTLRGIDILTRADVGYGLRLNPYYERTLRIALRKASAVTVASRHVRTVLESLSSHAEDARLLPNGVDLSAFHPGVARHVVREQYHIGAHALLLGVGNLVPLKRFENLVQATRLLRDAGVDARTLIVGEGPERPKLEALIQRLGLASQVQLCGRRPKSELPLFFASADVFVHPSLSEGVGNVVLEAMAAGRPVVATRTGVVPELIDDGETGWSVPLDDVSAIVDAVRRFLDDRPAMVRCGSAARDRVMAENLSSERRAQAFLELYSELLDG